MPMTLSDGLAYSKNTITADCYQAWIDIIVTQQTAVKNQDGTDIPMPDPHVITEFEKLPPVTGGLKNSFENFRDTAEQALSKVGNAIAPFATTAINAVDPLIVKVGELGTAFSGLPEPIKNVTVALAGLLIAVGPISTIVGKFQELILITFWLKK